MITQVQKKHPIIQIGLLVILVLAGLLLFPSAETAQAKSVVLPDWQSFSSHSAGQLPWFLAGSQSATATPTYLAPPTLPANLAYQTATPGTDGSIRHTVLDGQFLITIADLYGISLNDLLANNNLTADAIIFPGDVLIIKKAAVPTASLPAETALSPTATPQATSLPQAKLMENESSTPELTPTQQANIFQRVFNNHNRYLALAIIGLIVLGLVLLVVSSHRIQ